MGAAAITAEGLAKRYRIGEQRAAYGTLRDSIAASAHRLLQRDGLRRHHAREEIWALQDVTFSVGESEVLGVIGRNGAGKSTLLKILTRITTPTSGRAEIRGRVGSLLEVGTGFHPELTGRENIFLNGAILGMRRQEILSRFSEIVAFSGIEKFIDTPVKRYSSGMYVRLAFSVAAHFEPEVLLVDEVLAVGDAEFQQRCLGRMEDLSSEGRTVVFVSHSMPAVARLCDRAILLDGGRIVRDGPSEDVVAHYLQHAHGTGSLRMWSDVASAPGNDRAKLRCVRVVTEDGALVENADVRRPVGIEIAFTLLRPTAVVPKIKVTDPQGDVCFNAIDTDSRWDDPSPAGDHTATAWIPANLLNEGLYTVDVDVASLEAGRFAVHARMRDAVSFHVLDPAEGDSAKGGFVGNWRGSVRPLLDWTYERG